MPKPITKIRGLVAAPFTALNPDRSLALDQVEHQVEFLTSRGVSGAFICGTTGEGISLTVAERFALGKAWRKASAGAMKLIVHVGHSSIEDAKALAAQAEQIGADGIALMPASCLVPDSLPTLVDYCAEIAAAAPGLPFYYYHIPVLSRVHFKVHDLLNLAEERIPNLAGCKFTYEDMMDFSRSMSLHEGKFDLLFGRDEMMLSSLVVGAEAWVGSTYNFAAPLYLKIIAAYRAGEIEAARALQLEACEMIQILIESGGLPAMKALGRVLGLDLGPVRLPMRQPDSEQIRQMVVRLEKQGFMDYFQPIRKKDRHFLDRPVSERNGKRLPEVAA